MGAGKVRVRGYTRKVGGKVQKVPGHFRSARGGVRSPLSRPKKKGLPKHHGGNPPQSKHGKYTIYRYGKSYFVSKDSWGSHGSYKSKAHALRAVKYHQRFDAIAKRRKGKLSTPKRVAAKKRYSAKKRRR